jgi:hypothetical protein
LGDVGLVLPLNRPAIAEFLRKATSLPS